MWVAPAKDFWKDFERRESIYVLWTCNPECYDDWMGQRAVVCLVTRNKTQTHQRRNEAQLPALLFVPSSIMKWRGELSRVKMNAKKRAPLTALHATREVYRDVGRNKRRGHHVGLDFL